jgi:hypothetical protein
MKRRASNANMKELSTKLLVEKSFGDLSCPWQEVEHAPSLPAPQAVVRKEHSQKRVACSD